MPRRVQRFSGDNQMNTHNLAIVFGPTLFQTDGKDYKAGRVVEDLISHYVKIFNVGFGRAKLEPKKALPSGGGCCRTPGTRPCRRTGGSPRDGGGGREAVLLFPKILLILEAHGMGAASP